MAEPIFNVVDKRFVYSFVVKPVVELEIIVFTMKMFGRSC